MYCFLFNYCTFSLASIRDYTPNITIPSNASLRPRSPLHISLDLLSALHLNHGHSRAFPALWQVGEEKGGVGGEGLLHLLWQKFN